MLPTRRDHSRGRRNCPRTFSTRHSSRLRHALSSPSLSCSPFLVLKDPCTIKRYQERHSGQRPSAIRTLRLTGKVADLLLPSQALNQKKCIGTAGWPAVHLVYFLYLKTRQAYRGVSMQSPCFTTSSGSQTLAHRVASTLTSTINVARKSLQLGSGLCIRQVLYMSVRVLARMINSILLCLWLPVCSL
ncbi:hypothetical protein BC834DRAFT_890886 [Gloeopeniophorella convolvens]|nr:hypothetical protein BC834DRAFT_890886 [Gloeopeniophorella convolvens]